MIEQAMQFCEDIKTDIEQEYGKVLELVCDAHKIFEQEKCKLPYHINVIDELYINENSHSRILNKLLQFVNQEKKYEIFESLVRYIKKVAHSQEFEKIEVNHPTITQEKSRIDLWVRDSDGKYAIIFENKIYYAKDQEEQIARYIEKTEKKGFNDENIFVVYLSPSGEEPEEQSWGDRKENFKNRYVNLSFRNNILSWLEDDVLPNIRNKDVYLKSCVWQYIDYLKGLFNLRTIQNQMNMNLNHFIEEKLALQNATDNMARINQLDEKISEVEELANQMRNLKESYLQVMFSGRIKEKYPDHYEEKDGYGGVYVEIQDEEKKAKIFISEEKNQLYCQAEYVDDHEKPIENTRLGELLYKNNLLNEKNDRCVWKYFGLNDYNGVYDCFKETVNKILNPVKS